MPTLRLVLETEHFRALVAGKIVEFPNPAGRTPPVMKFGDWCDSKSVQPTMGLVENYASDMIARTEVALILSDIGFARMLEALDEAMNTRSAPMSPEEHQHQHQYLHRCFDELYACFLMEGRCSCYVPGSTAADPEGLTLRQAADAAVDEWKRIEALRRLGIHPALPRCSRADGNGKTPGEGSS